MVTGTNLMSFVNQWEEMKILSHGTVMLHLDKDIAWCYEPRLDMFFLHALEAICIIITCAVFMRLPKLPYALYVVNPNI